MNTQNKALINEEFNRLKADAGAKLGKIYEQILKEVSGIKPDMIGSEIVKKEAFLVNGFVQDFAEDVKKKAIQIMDNNGCKSYLMETGWTDILKKTGVPQMKYCKFQHIPNLGKNANNAAAATQSKIYVSEVAKLQKTQKVQVGVAVSGAAIAGATAAVASLTVPGWNTAEIVFVSLGAIMLVVGGTSAVISEGKIREARENEKIRSNTPRPASANLKETMGNAMKQQCQCNIRIINEWLDKVQEALIAECDELLNL